MKQLYIIRCYGGEYDDAWERVQFVTDDEVRGNAYIKNMTELSTMVEQVRNKLSADRIEWQRLNPLPNAINCYEHPGAYREWVMESHMAHMARIATYPEDIQAELENYSSQTYWDIEPVAWLE